MTARKRSDLSVKKIRSALTNGSSLFLGDIDERGPWCRRLRDLQRAHASDLGGYDGLSEGQRALLRRTAMLEVQIEMMESHWNVTSGGVASASQIETYQRCTNTLRRLLESLGLHAGRKARDVSAPTMSDDHFNRLLDVVAQEGQAP